MGESLLNADSCVTAGLRSMPNSRNGVARQYMEQLLIAAGLSDTPPPGVKLHAQGIPLSTMHNIAREEMLHIGNYNTPTLNSIGVQRMATVILQWQISSIEGSRMGKRGKGCDDSKKKAKFEDAESMPNFVLSRCHIDVHLINYHNPKSLIGHDFKNSNNPAIFLRSYTSVYTSDTPCMYDHHEFTGNSFGIPKKWCPEVGFTLWGKFCSLECCRAYIDVPSNSQRDRELSYLAMMARKLYGKMTKIDKLPQFYSSNVTEGHWK